MESRVEGLLPGNMRNRSVREPRNEREFGRLARGSEEEYVPGNGRTGSGSGEEALQRRINTPSFNYNSTGECAVQDFAGTSLEGTADAADEGEGLNESDTFYKRGMTEEREFSASRFLFGKSN